MMRRRFLFVLILTTISLTGTGCAYLDSNFRAVDPGAFYRSGQMSGDRLAQAIQDEGIATVINLRGASPDEGWYVEEVAVCASRSVIHHDLDWSMSRLPEPDSLETYIELVQTEPRPLLVHCQGGTHRAGIASAVYILLDGGDLGQARRQLGLFFGDAPIGELLNLYEGSTAPFSEWAATDYPALYAAHEGAGE